MQKIANSLTCLILLASAFLLPGAHAADASEDESEFTMAAPDCHVRPYWPMGSTGCRVGNYWVGCYQYTGALLIHDRDYVACGIFGCPDIAEGHVGRSVFVGMENCVVYGGHNGRDAIVAELSRAIKSSDAPPLDCRINPASHGCTVDITGRDTGVMCGVLDVGYHCGLRGFDCAQMLWGIHGSSLVVGGNNGCHAKVWSNLGIVSAAPPVDCNIAPEAHGCTKELGGRDTGVRCGVLAVGYNCALRGFDCTSALWGIHEPGFVVGGYNGCHAMVWVGRLG